MNVEIINIGTEILLGNICNTNSTYIAQKLAQLGLNCFYQTSVGDNVDRIKSILEIAFNRADIIITTGGLGPTDDDISIKTIGDFLGLPMHTDNDAEKDLIDYFKRINREMPSSNLKQVLMPQGAKIIKNPTGTAPGMLLETTFNGSKKIILSFPGVPKELYSMWENTAHEYLRQFSDCTIVQKFLNFNDIAEATINEKLRDILESENPTIAPYVGLGEAKLRIAAKAKDIQIAEKMIEKVQKQIEDRLGEYIYAYDDKPLESIIAETLLEKNLTVATAESCTGGLLSSRLTDISGSSNYITANLVTYSNEAKEKFLKVPSEILEKHGAVSEETAFYMANGVKDFADTSIGIGVTGIAGPTGGSEEKPVGLVYIGISSDKETKVFKYQFNPSLSRDQIKFLSTQKALHILRKLITT